VIVLALVAGCASRPGHDGPGVQPPSHLERVPDAVPRIEPLRAGGPNKPYEVLGQRYVPISTDSPLVENGLASWYGSKFQGLPTSSGEPYDMYAMTAAHKTMPIPSYARVRNPANGREVVVRINDRGPFAAGRVIDLSYTAALKLGVLSGVAPVQVRRITFDDIRAGGAGGGRLSAEDLAPGDRPDSAGPGPGQAFVTPVPGFWLQLGAFRSRESAVQLQQRVLRLGAGQQGPLSPAAVQAGGLQAGGVQAGGFQAGGFQAGGLQAGGLQAGGLPQSSGAGVSVFDEAGLFRVQAGPYANREQALLAAHALQRQTGLVAVLIERRP
jgi:rare lipoprotein A